MTSPMNLPSRLRLAALLVTAGCALPPSAPLDTELRAEVLALPANDVAGAIARVSRMESWVERGVTVELWIRQNRGRAPMGEALQLCRLVTPGELDACTRHLHALHLNRAP